jgi:hypothetical protein
MNTNKIVGVSPGTGTADAVNKQQLDAVETAKVNRAGDTMTGGLNMGNNVVTNLPPAVNPTDAVRLDQVLLTKVIDIGPWDISVDDGWRNVSFDLSAIYLKIRIISIYVRSDDATPALFDFLAATDGNRGSTTNGIIWSIGPLGMILHVESLGSVGTGYARFNSTGFNRGWITIQYAP